MVLGGRVMATMMVNAAICLFFEGEFVGRMLLELVKVAKLVAGVGKVVQIGTDAMVDDRGDEGMPADKILHVEMECLMGDILKKMCWWWWWSCYRRIVKDGKKMRENED